MVIFDMPALVMFQDIFIFPFAELGYRLMPAVVAFISVIPAVIRVKVLGNVFFLKLAAVKLLLPLVAKW